MELLERALELLLDRAELLLEASLLDELVREELLDELLLPRAEDELDPLDELAPCWPRGAAEEFEERPATLEEAQPSPATPKAVAPDSSRRKSRREGALPRSSFMR